ncbi:MAG: hypothetical protein R6U40_11550 [Desulfobacterales bacterium]
MFCNYLKRLDSGFRRNDGLRLRFSPRRRIVSLRAGGQPVGLTGRLPACYSLQLGERIAPVARRENRILCFLRAHQFRESEKDSTILSALDNTIASTIIYSIKYFI